jgi:predicted DNA-binding transcriptional regulator YafY
MPKTFVARLQIIDQLIQKRNTGKAVSLAQRLNVSERTAKEFIAVMKSLGAPIYYSRKAASYCYSKNGRFVLQFESDS